MKNSGKAIPKVKFTSKPSKEQIEKLLEVLKTRFEANAHLHEGVAWKDVEQKLIKHPEKLVSVHAMEETGGEPDVVVLPNEPKKLYVIDCAEQTPARRNICYDEAGEQERIKKGLVPGGNAISLAEQMGISVLSEKQYANLQALGEFDTQTSSWLQTPEPIRKLGGAIFGDCRYGKVFTYHNGAKSFYSDRGFRGILEL